MLSSNSYTSGPYTRSPTQFSSVNQPPVLQTSQVNFSPNVQRFQGSSIQSPYVHSDNLETLDHDILEMRNGLVSTKEKLKNFWTNAKRNPGYSQKCFLDARYFNNILTKEVYEGVVQEPMYIAIKEGNFTSDPNQSLGRNVLAQVDQRLGEGEGIVVAHRRLPRSLSSAAGTRKRGSRRRRCRGSDRARR